MCWPIRILLTVLLGASRLLAVTDWRDFAELPALQAELGVAMPTGKFIPIMMSEATPTYMPQAAANASSFTGSGALALKTIYPHSGASGASTHSGLVAGVFCGIGQSLAPDVPDLHVWQADAFITDLYYNTPAFAYQGAVQNHSWGGTTDDEAVDTAISRKMDSLIGRDDLVPREGVLIAVPLNNGSTMTKLPGNTYHTITVGKRNGQHPVTGSNMDGLGRMKPDIVVEQPDYTSLATPGVASAAACLLETIRASFPDADDPRVLKAIILAGASKNNLLGWKRLTTAKPYDLTFGAGELNLRNAYHILAAGRQPASNSLLRSTKGWDHGTATTGTPQRYFFTLPEGTWGKTFSALITWHRHFSSGVDVATMANLDLRLVSASGFTVGDTVDESISAVDNVEHLFRRNLLPGTYALEVSSDTAGEEFGIAWEVQPGPGPQVVAQRSGNNVTLNFSQLDPLKTYTVQTSTDLVAWPTATTFRTADITPATTATWSETTSAARRFYRLSWTP